MPALATSQVWFLCEPQRHELKIHFSFPVNLSCVNIIFSPVIRIAEKVSSCLTGHGPCSKKKKKPKINLANVAGGGKSMQTDASKESWPILPQNKTLHMNWVQRAALSPTTQCKNPSYSTLIYTLLAKYLQIWENHQLIKYLPCSGQT